MRVSEVVTARALDKNLESLVLGDLDPSPYLLRDLLRSMLKLLGEANNLKSQK